MIHASPRMESSLRPIGSNRKEVAKLKKINCYPADFCRTHPFSTTHE